MLAIEVDLLARRYTATAFNDRAATEWPPHPARLYSAMVAAWADADEPDDEERSALRWFEALDPPSITCADDPAFLDRTVVTHYVPVNDARSLRRDLSGAYAKLHDAERASIQAFEPKAAARAEKALAAALAKARGDGAAAGMPETDPSAQVVADVVAALPEARRKQPRTFPTVRIADGTSPLIRYEWPAADPVTGVADLLDAILARVARLGHSSTFVSCRVGEPAAAAATVGGTVTWRVDARGSGTGIGLRLPAEGSLDHLVRLHAVHEGRDPRSLPARFGSYRQAGPDRPDIPVPILGGPWRVLVLPPGHRVKLTRTLDISRAVRGALLSGIGDTPPPLLHGHRSGGSPAPAAQPHLAILPLANVGSPYADGVVHGVALVLPRDWSADDRRVLNEALARWRSRSASAAQGVLELRLLGGQAIDLEDRGADFDDTGPSTRSRSGAGPILERWFWTRLASRWATVTPIALDRFPGPVAAPDWEERAAATIAASCMHAGLPAPVEVEVVWGPPMRGVPAAGPRGVVRPGAPVRFGGYRAGTSGQVRLCVHARLRFDADVRGPVVLGAGRYAGYGMCLPIRAPEEPR